VETLNAREPWRLIVQLVFPGDQWIEKAFIVNRIFIVDADTERAAKMRATGEIIPDMKELLRQEGYKDVAITVLDR